MIRTFGIRLLLPIGLVALGLIILPSHLLARDRDGDGFHRKVGGVVVDCKDRKPAVYPGAPEICDGQDNQCPGDPGYGIVDEGCCGGVNADGDGYWSAAGCGTLVDCDDGDPNTYPGAVEDCGDGKDNQCPGDPGFGAIDEGCAAECDDSDGDTYYAQSGCRTDPDIVDCLDANPAVYPGAPELCDDAVDNNCDGTVNEGCAPSSDPTADSDNDGWRNEVEEAELIALAAHLETFDGETFIRGSGSSDCSSSIQCMNSSIADLFVILVTDPATNLDTSSIADYFEFLTNSVDDGGMGWQVWILQPRAGVPFAGRQVAASSSESIQKGLLLIEDLTPPANPPDKVGQSQYGSIHIPYPSGGIASFYSGRVSDFVDAVCSQSTSCRTSTGGDDGPDGIIFRYLQWLQAHELLHMMFAVPGTADKHIVGDFVMKSAIVHTDNDNVVTYYIPGTISSTTREAVGFFP